MNQLLLNQMIVFLNRLSRLGKIGVVFVIVLAVVCSIVLHTKGLSMDDSIAQWTTKPLMASAALAVIAELVSSMFRVQLRQVADRGMKQ
ncbi:MAG: hypothetical protein PPHEINF_4839 [uncultured Paraburkholderia sp.]|nr:MAG: hypothetical protein PPHEESC_1897 [uncultured Paraburkholderia sp.]CAH2799673.1 MAG: hypothetical protein PPHEINF_4839 [uncultured Paraburkholderia sp.]CAH2916109.1 MAG: hypothetical protein PPHERAN_1387 [uncultured Paraburkholderia sp.]